MTGTETNAYDVNRQIRDKVENALKKSARGREIRRGQKR